MLSFLKKRIHKKGVMDDPLSNTLRRQEDFAKGIRDQMRLHGQKAIQAHTEDPILSEALKRLLTSPLIDKSATVIFDTGWDVIGSEDPRAVDTKQTAFNDFWIMATVFRTKDFPGAAAYFDGNYLAWFQKRATEIAPTKGTPNCAHWIIQSEPDGKRYLTHLSIWIGKNPPSYMIAIDFLSPVEMIEIYGQDNRPEEVKRQWRQKSKKPHIERGMSVDQVISLLGPPSAKASQEELLGQFATEVTGFRSGDPRREFWIFNHSAGQYQLIISGNRVIEVYSQPK